MRLDLSSTMLSAVFPEARDAVVRVAAAYSAPSRPASRMRDAACPTAAPRDRSHAAARSGDPPTVAQTLETSSSGLARWSEHAARHVAAPSVLSGRWACHTGMTPLAA